MRRRPDHLILHLFSVSLVILAAMHRDGTARLVQLGTELLLAIVDGISRAAAAHPGPAILAAGLIYIAHQARTHRPRTHH